MSSNLAGGELLDRSDNDELMAAWDWMAYWVCRDILKRRIQSCLETLERNGLMMKNGEYRRAPNGLVEPVYVMTELGERERDWLRFVERRAVVTVDERIPKAGPV